MRQETLRTSLASLCLLALCSRTLPAQSPHVPVIATPSSYAEPTRTAEAVDGTSAEDEAIRATAIALNYCRASFHRIRKYPVQSVMAQEQEKILNNLNLQGIEDPEVIQLYTSVLDEINQIEVAGKEKQLRHAHHKNTIQRKITWDLLAFGTDLATLQYGSAVKQGANSWWDYRNIVYQRDSDLMKVDKTRMQSVTQKSSCFLDTFWKLARKKNIPDRWLVRGDDLDNLEAAQNEKDPETRLRILRRMEPYMQAYPPYWYYVARTEQELGSLIAASETYEQVAKIGDGHFRKDDMLATSLANLAAIQDHLGDPDAPRTAERALAYSTDEWETNLICARILERHHRIASAEDAILRNLDVDLESQQSLVFLASLYFHADEKLKLARMLERPAVVAELPAPVLLRCAACLGVERTPPQVMNAVMASLDVQPNQQYGSSELQVRMAPSWQLHLARVDVSHQGRRLPPAQVERLAEGHQLRFPGRFDFGRSEVPGVSISFTYPDNTVVQVAFQPDGGSESRGAFGLLPARAIGMHQATHLRMTGITVNDTQIALSHATPPAPTPGAEGMGGSISQ